MPLRPLAPALLGVAALVAPASAARADALDDLLAREMAARHVPGLSVAVLKDGKVVKAEGYGLADAEKKDKATAETVYQIASVTKQFTAAAVLLLVEEEKVGLDDAIGRYLAGLSEPWRPVTVRQLLAHTGGVPNYTASEAFGKAVEEDPKKLFTPRQILDLVADKPLDFAPGSEQRYSNTGYVLLGLLIEKVGGKPWGEFLKARIFNPLGMKDTRANDLAAAIPNRAQGYKWTAEGFKVADIVSPTQPYAAGALVSTVRDLAEWDAALSEGKILQTESWKQAWTPVALTGGKTAPYGFGWAVDSYRGLPRVHHNGGIPGFSSAIVRFPEQKTSVIVLANSETADAQSLALRVAAQYVPEIDRNAPKPIADAEPKTTERLRGVLIALATATADRNDFAESARKRLFSGVARQLGRLWRSGGPLSQFDLMAEGPVPGLEGRRRREYSTRFGQQQVRVMFLLDAAGKIAGMGLWAEE